MQYARRPGVSRSDFLNSKDYEEKVGTWLGDFKISNLTSTEKLDWWVPGFFIDVKERRQLLGVRWPLPEGCAHEDAMILDELSVRKAMAHFPHAYFLLRTLPEDRVFLARVDEVICGDHVRVNRVGNTGVAKGKWVINVAQFRQLDDPANELLPAVLADQVATPWKQSGCLVPTLEEDDG